MEKKLKIGELAASAGCSVETVRYYEKAGLLPAPERSDNNYRVYGAVHVERLRLIRNCRALDMTLDEVRLLLDGADTQPGMGPCGGNHVADRMLSDHIGHVDARLRELETLKQQLTVLRQRCREGRDGECGVLQGLAELDLPESANHRTHLG